MAVAKRIFASVPDYVEAVLKIQAERQGRSLSSLVAFFLENAANEALQDSAISAEYEAEQNKGAKR